ncbi:MAG: 4-(cytidine 5'-diphospho)-2-C-methyl-D-erythritol kinase [Bacillales bacterium]|jgi:4-diphosphocytidyl-2-C-methyl-D-erythritol kinase|nr:4-(cytidine 5'-diphospho)-2-C-methyl-D-erythritol kinase [Bacillales bacterium]
MKSIKINAHAKVNIGLYITGKDTDGYHYLDSIFKKIPLKDEIYIFKTKTKRVIIRFNGQEVPIINTVSKAVFALQKDFPIVNGIEIIIDKYIPFEAGLGGGSSDAASVLYALNKLFDLHLSKERLLEYGRKVGSDVSFFLIGSINTLYSCRVQGKGEKVKLFPLTLPKYLLVIKPKNGISTQKAYELIDNKGFNKSNLDNMVSDIKNKRLVRNVNDFEPIIKDLNIQVKEILDHLKEPLRIVSLTGSGSCVFVYDNDEDKLDKIREQLTHKIKDLKFYQY